METDEEDTGQDTIKGAGLPFAKAAPFAGPACFTFLYNMSSLFSGSFIY